MEYLRYFGLSKENTGGRITDFLNFFCVCMYVCKSICVVVCYMTLFLYQML